MKATHRVKDSAGNPVGYIVDEKFYTEEYLKDNIQFIENLSLMEGKVSCAEVGLEETSYKAAVADREYNKLIRAVSYTHLTLPTTDQV